MTDLKWKIEIKLLFFYTNKYQLSMRIYDKFTSKIGRNVKIDKKIIFHIFERSGLP